MKINKRKGIAPEIWGLKSESEFLKDLEGEENIDVLKAKYQECVEICKEKGLIKPKPKAKKEQIESND